jgi:hypothetical protein
VQPTTVLPVFATLIKEALMGEAFRLGGWGMYPTAIAGALLVAMSARYAFSPQRQRLPLLVCLQVLTFFIATLGFVTGLIKSTTAAGELANPLGPVIEGFGESLVNIGWGLVLMVIATIATAIGLSRARSSGGSSLVDPLRGT